MKTKTKGALTFLITVILVGALALSFTACGDDDPAATPPSGGGSNTGGGGNGDDGVPDSYVPLNISSQVYRDESYWTGTSYTDRFTAFTGTETVIGIFETRDSNTDIPIGGAGDITNGVLNFSIEKPLHLISIAEYFNDYKDFFDNFNISNSNAECMYLGFDKNLYRGRWVISSKTSTSESGTDEWVEYLFVDRNVTISGRGKTYTETYGDETYHITSSDTTLNLRAGWNTLYTKYEYSGQNKNFNYTVTMSLSDPSDVKWRLGYIFRPINSSDIPPASSTPLTAGVWANAEFTASLDTVHWYSFEVTNGTPYYFWINQSNNGDGTKYGEIRIHMHNGMFLGSGDHWTNAWSFTPFFSGTAYVRVTPDRNGSYAIAYNTSPSRPPVTP